MKAPRKTKYKKYYKLKIKKKEIKKTKLCYGIYGIKAVTNGYIRMGQLKRIKEHLVKKLKNKTDIYFNFYPIYGITNKGTARMGSGKGDVDDWYMPARSGKILIEFSNCKIPENEIRKIIKVNAIAWPIKIKFTALKKHFDEIIINDN